MKKIWWLLILLAGAAGAEPMVVLMPGADIFGAPTEVVGWGYTLTNDDTGWVALQSATFLSATSVGTFEPFTVPFDIVAPGGVLIEAFDGVATGVGRYTISAGAAAGASATGMVRVVYDWFNLDPNLEASWEDPGFLLVSGLTVEVPASVTVAAAAAVPEPRVPGLVAAALALFALRRLWRS